MIARLVQRLAVIVLVMGVMEATTGAAMAGLLGHTIHSQYFAPSLTNLYDDQGIKTVSPSATFTAIQGGGPFLQAKLTDTNLTITSVFGGPQYFGGPTTGFNGFSFTDLGGNLGISSVTIDPITNMVGLDASRITLTQGRLLINFVGLYFRTDGVISLSLAPATVPEPSSLFLVSFAGAAVLGRLLVSRKR